MTTPITAERLREVLDYDPDTGVFLWRVALCNRVRAGSVAGRIDKDGRRRVMIAKATYFASRLAWFYVYGDWPAGHIDHINGCRADDRLANLRDVTRAMNMQNQARAHRSNRSGLIGAHWCSKSGAYRSSIWLGGKNHHLGHFDTAEEAHQAYVNAKLERHAGFVAARFGGAS